MDTIEFVCTRVIPAPCEYTGDSRNWPFWQNLKDNSVYFVNHYGDENYRPITRDYYFGLCSAIGVGAYDDDGILVEVSLVFMGFTDKVRGDIARSPELFIGKVAQIQVEEKDGRSFRYPVFKSWEEDKDPLSCKISDIFS